MKEGEKAPINVPSVVVMRGFKFKCLMIGHDDRMHRAEGRVYLECAECGSQTRGWTLSDQGDVPVSPAPSARVAPRRVRSLWSQVVRRRRFQAEGPR